MFRTGGARASYATPPFLDSIAMHAPIRLCELGTFRKPILTNGLVRIDLPEWCRTQLEKRRQKAGNLL